MTITEISMSHCGVFGLRGFVGKTKIAGQDWQHAVRVSEPAAKAKARKLLKDWEQRKRVELEQ